MIGVFMSEILQFPGTGKQHGSDVESAIEKALNGLPKPDKEKIRFELIKTIDHYDGFFTVWSLNVPEDADETFKKQIYDIAHQEHARKMQMLDDIVKLKVRLLVAEYYQRRH
jgi:hypothetical protein